MVTGIDHILHTAGDRRSNGHPHAAAEFVVHDGDVSARPMVTRPLFAWVPHARQDRKVVVAAVDVVVLNQHVLAGVDVNSIAVESGNGFIAHMREPGNLDLNVVNVHVPAVGRMESPERAIQQRDAADLNPGHRLQFHQVRAADSVVQLARGSRPPIRARSVDDTVAGDRDVGASHCVDEGMVSSLAACVVIVAHGRENVDDRKLASVCNCPHCSLHAQDHIRRQIDWRRLETLKKCAKWGVLLCIFSACTFLLCVFDARAQHMCMRMTHQHMLRAM